MAARMEMEEPRSKASGAGRRKRFLVLLIPLAAILIALTTVVVVVTMPKKSEQRVGDEHGAVAADAKECSEVGLEILKKGGHAVDAAIASLFCSGVVNFHSTGIGGGGFMTIYDRSKKQAIVLDYRETSPAALKRNSFDADPTLAEIGGLAVGVPSIIRGLQRAHMLYGKLPWKDLVEPAIRLAKNGTRIGKHLANQYEKSSTIRIAVLKDPGLRELLVGPDGKLKTRGDLVKNPKYAATLEIIRDDPEDFYSGNLSKIFIEEVRDRGGVLTSDDLMNYRVLEKAPLKNDIRDLVMHTTPLPGGGSVLIHILNMNEGYNFSSSDLETEDKRVLNYHRMVESFKFSYAKRVHLGDPDSTDTADSIELRKSAAKILSKLEAERCRLLINDSSTQTNDYYDNWFVASEDEGTTHVSVIDAHGNAVAATETINYSFGAKFRSMKTGIIYNNELADFFTNSSFPSKDRLAVMNAPGPNKRPLSSTCPTIITDRHGDVRMVVGGSGGTRITLSVALVIMKTLWFGQTLEKAVDEPRPQHSFFPEFIREEDDYPLEKAVVEGLILKGHEIRRTWLNAIVQAIYIDDDGRLFAKSDSRKGGYAAVY